AEDGGLLTALGGFVAQALGRARLYDAEFALDHHLQEGLVQQQLGGNPGVEITVGYLPGTEGREIAGDW
ncbi:hypothetical protein VM98_38860, partial [Streptomyces rubellomurinus subsp. indigoferus]